ncbi:MinD/ParA family ATP-binding protein [Jatrophihabitans fulvus]
MTAPRHHRDPAPPARPSARVRAARLLRRATGVAATRDAREYVELQLSMGAAVTSGRRVAVLSVEPGQGTTTVSGLLAVAFAARRQDPVLLVDAAAPGANPLHHVFGAEPVRTLPDLAARPPRIGVRTDIDGVLTPLGRDLWLLPNRPDPGWAYREATRGPDADTYAVAFAPFARWFDISVTDLGHAAGPGTVDLLLERAHALVLVTSGRADGIDAVLARLRQFRDEARVGWAGRTVVVVNRRPGDVGGGRRARVRADVPVTELGPDPALAPGFPHRLARLDDATHRSALRLAAQVLDTALPTAVAR